MPCKHNNSSLTEDFQWLQALKDLTRRVTIGSKDVKMAKKLKRKLTERNKELERKMMKYPNEQSESVNVEGNLTDNEESKDDQDDETFIPFCSNQTVSKKKNLFNPELCKVADKYQISHRALTEIVFADKVTNESSNQVSLSVMTCKRQRAS